ncbi:MAG: BamA/TamA family outer membrane protein [Candidatus Solibacter usitatus]|nr:BamA/TamA family outer membrane protein [Candidatus Solibacter usitatus]
MQVASRGRFCRLALLLLSHVLFAVAAPLDFEGKPVAEIRFEPDGQPLSITELSLITSISPGQSLTAAAVRNAIQKLYATGRYEDLRAAATLRDGQVVLTFITTWNWFIGRVTVDGVDEPPNREQLISATKLELGSLYSKEQLDTAAQGLKTVLLANGYYAPNIRSVVEQYPEHSEVQVQFVIDPGDRAYYSRPKIGGDFRLPEKLILGSTHWMRWWGLLGWHQVSDQLTTEGIDRVRRAYLKRDYLLSKVDLKQLEVGADKDVVTPHLHINAGPLVRVTAPGAKLSKGALRDLVPVYQEHSVDQDLLAEGGRKITQYFQSRGYFDAQVTFTRATPSATEQTIEYQVERGDRYKVVRVDIKGNRYFDALTIRERINTLPARLLAEKHGRYSEDILARDKSAIEDLYRGNGFRDARVRSNVERNFGGKERQVAVTFEIVEGEQVFVNSLEISGVDLKLYAQVLSLVTANENQPYSALALATDRDNLLNFYNAAGYPNATMDILSTPSRNPRMMDVKYVVQEGRRQFVRDVAINGLSGTRRSLVSSRISLRPGAPLSLGAMVFSQRRLYDLGIFAKVDMAIQNPLGNTREKLVLYHLEEGSRYSVNGGIGAEFGRFGGSATSLNAPAGSSGFAPRVSLGVSRLNFMGLGHTVGVQTRFSTLERRVLATYLAPQFQDRENLSLTLTALYDDSRNVRTFNSRRFEGALQVGQRFSRALSAQYRIVVRRVSTTESKIDPALIPLFSQPVRVGLAAITLVRDHRDDPLNATRGSYFSVDLSMASKVFLSEPSFGRLLGRNSSYHRLTRDLVLSRNTTFGFIGNYGGADIPLPERFFAGGAVSHRAFPENQAGPRDLVTGFPVGGRSLLFNQTELRFPVLGNNVGGVLFHDAGNVYSGLSEMSIRWKQRDEKDFDYMVHALGFGVRYRTPIGPIRLDFAYGINAPAFQGYKGSINDLINNLGERVSQRVNRFQFHFSLGQAF